jgi:Rab3 GTPase-activating protein catalytic subunit
MTEDMIDEYTSYLTSLDGGNDRVRAQLNVLLSDMQAFKAANPGSVLEDFVRWHSPRDFENGALSERMRIPGNLWEETWRSARPIPVSQQVRLFNETKEAEKVISIGYSKD